MPPTAVGGLFKSGLSVAATRVTATLFEFLGSIQTVRSFEESWVNLNHPPTAVGGIRKGQRRSL